MRVPYQLHWHPPRPATALYYPGDVAGLLSLCARVGGPDLPPVHAAGDGFLVVLPRPSDAVWPGALRLRSLAAGVYLPVDAELSPSLLADEAEALGRPAGLIFLPGGPPTSFDPDVRLGPADLLRLPLRPRRGWRPPPGQPARPAGLTGVVLDLPPGAEPDVLGGAGEGVGGEAPRPPEAGVGGRAAGGLLGGLGQGLDWLGRQLNSQGLRRLAAGFLRRAMERAPRLSEKLLGKHESALRELLRRFREGDLDDALRHAVPLGGGPGRGDVLDDDPRLVARDFRWGRDDLDPGAGAGGRGWLSPDELYRELREQYRKAAEEAVARGDFLRAAAIHGKLLGDWRMAALYLERAGRHHDAARVYLERLNDDVAAARALEAAGETDRAVALHVQHGRFLEAADLLRRVGEAERAAGYYLQAAWVEANAGRHAAAARLLTERAGAPEQAESFLCLGWQGRPSTDAVECLHELTATYLAQKNEGRLRTLLDEADAHFAPAGDDAAAARFYNRLANRAPGRDDLRDRALRGLAGKLRQRAGEGDRGVGVVSLLFAQQGRWDPTLLRDAEVALRGVPRPPQPRPRDGGRRVTIHPAGVRAVAQAAGTGAVVVGFADGCIAHFDPVSGRVSKLTASAVPVASIACSADGATVVVVRQDEEGFTLASYELHPDVWISTLSRPLTDPREGRYGLTATQSPVGPPYVGLYTEEALALETGPNRQRAKLYFNEPAAVAFLLPGTPASGTTLTGLALHHGGHGSAFAFRDGEWSRPCGPTRLAHFHELDPGLRPSFLCWPRDDVLCCEIAWCSTPGNLHWVSFEVRPDGLAPRDAVYGGAERCACVALLDAGRLAAVHDRGILWLRADGLLRVQGRTGVAIPEAVAAFASPKTADLLVVTQGGDVVRVPLPG